MKWINLFAALGVVAFRIRPAQAADDVVLKFGLYASEKPSKMIRQFRPILNRLEKSLTALLGRKVRIKTIVARSYAEGQDNLVSGRVDFSRMGPASYVAVKRRTPEISVLALESRRGRKEFHGVISITSDSNVHNLADLKGKNFAFGSERSTIGRYLSQLLLLENGVRAADLARYEYLGRHDLVGTAIAAKKFDAGALKESTFKAMVEKGRKIRAIALIKNVTQPWIAAAQLSIRMTVALRQSLLQMRDAKALKALNSGPLLAGSDDDFNLIRRAIDMNYQFFK